MATDYNKLKVTELKAELKRLGLPQSGLKADLVARLEEAIAGVADSGTEEAPEEAPASVTGESTGAEPEAAPVSHTDTAAVAEDVGDLPQNVEEPTITERLETTSAAEPDMTKAVDYTESTMQDAPAAQLPDSEETLAKGLATPADDAAPESVQAVATADFANVEPQPQGSTAPLSLSVTPAPSAEILQDSQKRKRRSQSPAPLAADIAAKRTRLNSEERDVDIGVAPSETENKEIVDVVDDVQNSPVDVAMGGMRPESPADKQANTEVSKETIPHNSQGPSRHDSDMVDYSIDNDADQPPPANIDTHINDALPNIAQEEDLNLEQDVEPSTHSATCALYIKNFMRPLRPQAVRDHLLDLATPKGLEIDEGTVSGFYLDNIRTHSFVLFNSITAAKRVRNALHNHVWPDETNRKPLWIDYIPPERYHDWVEMEQSAGGGRGSGNRYEVVYEHDNSGNIMATLEESAAAAPATKPVSQLERKQSIPTGPGRGVSGIEGAPTGPRGFQGAGRAPAHAARGDRVGEYQSTIARPAVPFQPVSDEIAHRRLATMRQAKSRDYDQTADKNKEYRRYFFEHGDHLVDRGPEIFLGIRPPHRERERRQEQERDDRRRGDRGRRNGNGRRGGMPIYHGVPKGGDRYRGAAADYDDRPRHNDRAGDRYRGQNYNRY